MNIHRILVINLTHVDQLKDRLHLKNGWLSRNITKIEQRKKVRLKDKTMIDEHRNVLVYESTRLRESIFHTIGQSSADLESQGKASEYALRKRLHEMERSLKELEWQKKQVKEKR